MSIEQDADLILRALAEAPRDGLGQSHMNGAQLTETTGLEPHRVNDAIALLDQVGLIELMNWMGTAPYMFGQATITARGRYELERSLAAAKPEAPGGAIARHPSPVGSPYGFNDQDWEYVADRRSRADSLRVVLGYQFESQHYRRDALARNIEGSFQQAVQAFGEAPGNPQVALDFSPLAAGYGEHLFNEIARDIISADIAVFELSDLNPNVMLELGVALTWGVRVLPIKLEGRPKPPSDISGQTWVDYRDNAAVFTDPDHARKLIRMVERAIRKKMAG